MGSLGRGRSSHLLPSSWERSLAPWPWPQTRTDRQPLVDRDGDSYTPARQPHPWCSERVARTVTLEWFSKLCPEITASLLHLLSSSSTSFLLLCRPPSPPTGKLLANQNEVQPVLAPVPSTLDQGQPHRQGSRAVTRASHLA